MDITSLECTLNNENSSQNDSSHIAMDTILLFSYTLSIFISNDLDIHPRYAKFWLINTKKKEHHKIIKSAYTLENEHGT